MKYRKKPIVIGAEQLTRKNFDTVLGFVGGGVVGDYGPGEFEEDACYMEIKTLEGVMLAHEGDWIICGVKGEFYPCKEDIFEATYSPASTFPVGGSSDDPSCFTETCCGLLVRTPVSNSASTCNECGRKYEIVPTPAEQGDCDGG